MSRVKSAFGIETKMFDPDESVAKGAAIYANKMSEFNIVLEEIAKQQGKSVEEVKEQVDKGQMNLQKEAKKANIQMRGGRLPGEDVKIINVSSRSFGTCAYDETDQLKLFNELSHLSSGKSSILSLKTLNFLQRVLTLSILARTISSPFVSRLWSALLLTKKLTPNLVRKSVLPS